MINTGLLRQFWIIPAIVLAISLVVVVRYGTQSHDDMLLNAIIESELNAVDKCVFSSIAANPKWREDGLVKRLFGPTHASTIVWSQTVLINENKYMLCIVDQHMRTAASTPVPLVALVLDSNGDLLFWKPIAPYSVGFVKAHIYSAENSDALSLFVTAKLNWAKALGTWEYTLGADEIYSHGDSPQKSDETMEELDRIRHRKLDPIDGINSALG